MLPVTDPLDLTPAAAQGDAQPHRAAGWRPARRTRWHVWLGVVLAVPALLLGSRSVLGRSSLASPYKVSVAVNLQPNDPQMWAMASAGDFEAARAIDANLPDPMAVPALGDVAPVATPLDPMSLRQEAYVGPAAQRYVFRGATPTDTARAHYCLTAALYYEAASESDDGMRGVAQVVLNRVRHPSFPGSVCGVVFQGSNRAIVCQFTFSCDGSMSRPPARGAWSRASRIAAEALAGRTYPGVGLATHYHTLAVRPSWSSTLAMTNVVGAHIFHRWRGRWGTPAAFSRAYAGREPVPGPYLPIADQLAARAARRGGAVLPPTGPAGSPDAATLSAIARAGTPAPGGPVPTAPVAPMAGMGGQPVAPPPAAAPPPTYADPRLNRSGTVRDEYRNSGAPVRR